MKEEEWVAAPGYEEGYSVSSWGRVRTEGVGRGRTPGRILKATPGAVGYPVVTLWSRNTPKVHYVHRLVCEAFHGPAPEGKPNVLHWDDDPLNNHVENLRWGSQKENIQDAGRNGRLQRARKTHCGSGHALDGYNLMIFPSGGRACRDCRVKTTREWRENKRKLESGEA